jgi:hypothetical protein
MNLSMKFCTSVGFCEQAASRPKASATVGISTGSRWYHHLRQHRGTLYTTVGLQSQTFCASCLVEIAIWQAQKVVQIDELVQSCSTVSTVRHHGR